MVVVLVMVLAVRLMLVVLMNVMGMAVVGSRRRRQFRRMASRYWWAWHLSVLAMELFDQRVVGMGLGCRRRGEGEERLAVRSGVDQRGGIHGEQHPELLGGAVAARSDVGREVPLLVLHEARLRSAIDHHAR
jgi:hypothetical protein